MAECKIEENLKDCPCTYPGCSRKGKCCDCLKYHLGRNELPACCFSPEVEKTFDRSFERFVKINS
ncbi:cytosolic protein [Patescibacteria group bacterium]|nr:cytosolic protein [Patescibacteria group bacterium]